MKVYVWVLRTKEAVKDKADSDLLTRLKLERKSSFTGYFKV